LKYEDGVKFADSLDYVKQKLLELIGSFVETSHNFSRPDNTLAKTEKTIIWKIEMEDEVVQ